MIEFILKFKDIMKMMKKILKILFLNNSKSLNIPLIATQEVFYIK